MEKRRIQITDSPELAQFRLKALIGHKGFITEDLSEEHRSIKGLMVYLDEPFLGEHTWFIPIKSIAYEE